MFTIGGIITFLNPSPIGNNIYIFMACIQYWVWAIKDN